MHDHLYPQLSLEIGIHVKTAQAQARERQLKMQPFNYQQYQNPAKDVFEITSTCLTLVNII